MSDVFVLLLLRFFRLILASLHCAYSGVQYFDLARAFIKKKIKENFLHVNVPDAQLFVSNFVKELKKCPSHFVIIVGEDGISLEDFTNLVVWCIAAKITFVSFYDYSGHLKANQNAYYKYLVSKGKLNPNILSYSLQKNSSKNGISPKIHLNFLSIEDGKPLLVQLTKDISKRVTSNELKITDITESFINKELFKLNGLPEPDLAVIGGTVCSSFGLLPWHIKVTEFLQLRTLKGIQVSDFTSVLEAYSSCNQRFGK
ncbi:hypothetical protein RUM44_012492 [Polyplax serrata]|uniref:ditrans,polycis-polyprenyl diphosphate synthase [(2E,6E)-farnesyldiphosphate specific] n=1 Tax=Polyplax serrata TaxID=468196 RepID=A0ABR1BDJ7_POLSC